MSATHVCGPHVNLFFEDFVIGSTFAGGPTRAITAEMIRAFAELSGDFNGLHVDEEYARARPFGKIISHGLLGLSMATGLLHDMGLMRETVVAFGKIDWKFKGPIFVGDRLTLRMTVTNKKAVKGQGLVTFDVELFNQDQKLIQEGRWGGWVKTRRAS